MFEELFLPHDGIYLLNHSVGRPPIATRNAVLEGFFEPWESGDAEVWPIWLEKIENFRNAVAQLLNARATDICPQTNLSSAATKIIHALPRRKGKTVIVCSELDFPSIGFVLTQAERAGYTVRMIPAHLNIQNLDTWRNYLAEDVALTLITQVLSNTGQLLPVQEITELTRTRDIVSIVDICQSVGAIPIDLQKWCADFAIGSCVKWLCGGPGAAFLWVDPHILEACEPMDVGWFSHADPFEFDIKNFRYADSALRFWGGTPSVLPYVMACAGLNTIQTIGVNNIRGHNLALTDQILNALPPEYAITPEQPAMRGGTLVLNPGNKTNRVVERLNHARVRFDTRDTGIRMSPHIYNTQEQMNTVLSCIL